MKILDRYVIFSFIRNYVISFMVLVGMYVVLDMVFNFNSMVQLAPNASAIQSLLGTLADMADYYFYQCFLFFVHLSGIIPVVAAAFTLMRLSRFNELTAMLAAGVPLLRVAAPIVVVGLLLNGLLLFDQEYIIPAMIPKLVRDHDQVHKEASNWFPIDFMQDAQDGLLRASQYHARPPAEIHPPNVPSDGQPLMRVFDLTERRPTKHLVAGVTVTDLEPFAHIRADWAIWNPKTGTWDLINGFRVTGIGRDGIHSPEVPIRVYRGGITPEEISLYRSGHYVDLLSTERINQLLERHKSYGELNLLRVKHWRFTQPLMNVILLLLAIPCVLSREPGAIKTGATRCLLLMALGMGSVFLSQQMAGSPPPGIGADRWAALMAWMPIFIFGPYSVYLLEKIKT